MALLLVTGDSNKFSLVFPGRSNHAAAHLDDTPYSEKAGKQSEENLQNQENARVRKLSTRVWQATSRKIYGVELGGSGGVGAHATTTGAAAVKNAGVPSSWTAATSVAGGAVATTSMVAAAAGASKSL